MKRSEPFLAGDAIKPNLPCQNRVHGFGRSKRLLAQPNCILQHTLLQQLQWHDAVLLCKALLTNVVALASLAPTPEVAIHHGRPNSMIKVTHVKFYHFVTKRGHGCSNSEDWTFIDHDFPWLTNHIRAICNSLAAQRYTRIQICWRPKDCGVTTGEKQNRIIGLDLRKVQWNFEQRLEIIFVFTSTIKPSNLTFYKI